ncbi:MAG: hypothetical protein AB1716_07100 [Planctomycetota bacterium]
MGEDAAVWARFAPQRAWFAVYADERDSQRIMRVRAFAFASRAAAETAYEALRPLAEHPFEAGDAAVWTECGVMFRWGKLVFDIFGADASWGSQTQATLLATLITRRMPAGLPEEPQ